MVFIVETFLGPEFGLQLWPVAYENIPICEKMVGEQRWQTNPLVAKVLKMSFFSHRNIPLSCLGALPKFHLLWHAIYVENE